MTTILGLSGSLRRASYNTALLRAAREVAPDGVELEIGSIAGIPLYDGDVESEHGLPAAVAELKEKIVAADGLLLVTPEYNNSLPGVFKNAIDWLSRPAEGHPARLRQQARRPHRRDAGRGRNEVLADRLAPRAPDARRPGVVRQTALRGECRSGVRRRGQARRREGAKAPWRSRRRLRSVRAFLSRAAPVSTGTSSAVSRGGRRSLRSRCSS